MAHAWTDNYLTDDLGDRKDWNYRELYYQSKLAVVMFTLALADKCQKTQPNIKVVCLHPGIVASNIYKNSCFFSTLMCIGCCVFISNEKGAETSLLLGRREWKELRNGGYYYRDEGLVLPSKASRNKE